MDSGGFISTTAASRDADTLPFVAISGICATATLSIAALPIARILRPVSYQDTPEALVPPVLLPEKLQQLSSGHNGQQDRTSRIAF